MIKKTVFLGVIGSLVVSVLFFYFAFGFQCLDGRFIGWVMNGDMGDNFIAWDFFRHAPWTFPPGKIPTLLYPVGSTLIQGDAVPLLSLILKLVQSWLPTPFQYQGIWYLFCFCLNGILGFLISYELGMGMLAAVGASFFYVAMPAILWRSQLHPSFVSHWIILIPIYAYLRFIKLKDDVDDRTASALIWLNLIISVGVNIYTSVMGAVLTLACYYLRYKKSSTKKRRQSLIYHFLILLLSCVGMGAVLGYFNVQSGQAGGFGINSADLLSFFSANPFPDYKTSQFMPVIPVGKGQYEGFAYLGLGLISLFFFGIARLPKDWSKAWFIQKQNWLYLTVGACLMWCYSLSWDITIAGHPILHIHSIYALLPKALPGTFRTSGRFVWPLMYLITAWATIAPFRLFKKQTAVAILFATVALQMIDLGPWILNKNLRSANKDWNLMKSPRWEELAVGHQILNTVPPFMESSGPPCDFRGNIFDPLDLSLGFFAAEHGMSFNGGVTARPDAEPMIQYCEKFIKDINAGKIDNNAIYIVPDEYFDIFMRGNPKANCEVIDGIRACVSSI